RFSQRRLADRGAGAVGISAVEFSAIPGGRPPEAPCRAVPGGPPPGPPRDAVAVSGPTRALFARVRRLIASQPLRGDQLVQPAHLALDRLQAVPLELQGVPVHPLPGARQPGAEGLDPLFQPAAPALQDPEPDIRPGLAEEG